MAALVVLISVIVGLAMAGLLSPVAGLHKYVVPATDAAPSWPIAPEHSVRVGPGFATAAGFTVTATVLVLWQPGSVVAVKM